MDVHILQLKSLTRDDAAELNGLLEELRPDCEAPTGNRWRQILGQKDLVIFIAREEKRIVGMAILRFHELPLGRVGTVEDVIVSAPCRGRGYGSALTKAIIGFAKKQRMVHIDLTSRPSRKAANKLYQKFGWKKRRTNVYRLLL